MEGGLRKALGYTASGNRHCYWQVRAGCRSLAHRREPISQDLAARSRLPRCGSRSRVKAGLHSLATHQELDGVEKALSLRRDHCFTDHMPCLQLGAVVASCLSQLGALAQVHDTFTMPGPTLPRISDRSIARLANESPSTRRIRRTASRYWPCRLVNKIFEMPYRSDLSLSSSHRIGVGDLVVWWVPTIR